MKLTNVPELSQSQKLAASLGWAGGGFDTRIRRVFIHVPESPPPSAGLKVTATQHALTQRLGLEVSLVSSGLNLQTYNRNRIPRHSGDGVWAVSNSPSQLLAKTDKKQQPRARQGDRVCALGESFKVRFTFSPRTRPPQNNE
jgi:hypothetical protein